MDTRSSERPHQNVLIDLIGGQCCKVEDNDVLSGSYQIRDVG